MAEYRYKASYADGKIFRGRRYADGPSILRQELSAEGAYLLEYSEVLRTERRRMNSMELAEFCRELSSMLCAGISVAKALEIIRRRKLSSVVSDTFQSLSEYVERGETLSSAMEKQKGTFPLLVVKVVAAGEESGMLDKLFSRLADHYEREHRIKSEIYSAVSYPVVLFVMTVMVIIAIFAFVFPAFSRLLDGMKLPLITQIMMWISKALTEHLYAVLLVVIALIGLFAWIGSTDTYKRFFDRTIIKVPVFGDISRKILTARFARIFSLLYSGGIPAARALEMTFETMDNSYISGQADNVLHCVRSGMSLSAAVGCVDGFDSRLIDALLIGEESGRIDELLVNMSDICDNEASAAIKRALKILEPIMILIMAAVILTVVLSVMLPIYDMYSGIGAAGRI